MVSHSFTLTSPHYILIWYRMVSRSYNKSRSVDKGLNLSIVLLRSVGIKTFIKTASRHTQRLYNFYNRSSVNQYDYHVSSLLD